MKKILLLSLVLLASCSTVERYSYFTPVDGADSVEGSKKQSCGMKNFGGEPDLAVFNSDYGHFNVESNSSFEPYLWGPWLITVVPVFPVTWVADLALNPELEISAYSQEKNEFLSKAKITAVVTLNSGKTLSVEPNSLKAGAYGVHATFPVKSEKVASFVLTISGANEKKVAITFNKASRWAWSQWSPNC